MIRKTLPPVLVVCLFLVAALAAGPSTAQGRLTDSGGSSRVWGDARSELVDRLFRAVLGRAPGPDEAARAADEVASGRLGELIDTMVASSEYRSRRTGTRQLAERFFRGLFDRSPSSQEAYGLGRDLGGGRDAQAIRRLVDSDEFLTVLEMRPAVAGGPEPAEDERREEDREEGEAERACRAALESRISQELGRSVGLRLLSAEVTASTVLSEVLEGTAELDDPPRKTLTYTCRVDRFGNEVSEVTYRLDEEADAGREILIRCESQRLRVERCPVDTSGGVVLERQEGSAPCIEGQTWGTNANGIWVQLGCRGLFRVTLPTDAAGVDSAVEGWGFVRQGDGRAEWLSRAAVVLESGGAARIELSGEGTARFAGRWYDAGEDRVGITLDGPTDADRSVGAGELKLSNRELEYLELAGQTGAMSFDIVFTRRAAATPDLLDAAGQGFAELSGGRRALLDRATVDLANDGRVTMRFSGESEETLTGRWFVGWGNPVQLAIDGPSEGTAGFGTVHRDPEGRFEVVISGVTSRGQSFRIEFASER